MNTPPIQPRGQRPSEAAFRAHYAAVKSFLLRRTHDPHVAEELAQQVFAQAVEHLDGANRWNGPILAWLYTVADRRFVDEMRRDARGRARLRSLEILHEDDDAEFGATATARSLKRAILTLSDEHRDVVVAKLLEGRSFGEISRSEGAVGEAALKMRYSRALALLRQRLQADGIGE